MVLMAFCFNGTYCPVIAVMPLKAMTEVLGVRLKVCLFLYWTRPH